MVGWLFVSFVHLFVVVVVLAVLVAAAVDVSFGYGRAEIVIELFREFFANYYVGINFHLYSTGCGHLIICCSMTSE